VRIAVTGATGKLGRLAIEALLARVPPTELVALARDPGKAADLAGRGVAVRQADYDRPETLGPALSGVDKLLFVSASELGKRARQHAGVVEAARRAGVKLVAYTSVLRADSSRLGLAEEHRRTEQMIRDAGLPFVFLRNGWYLENYTENLAPALAHGALLGSAGEGRIAAAARADYAEAAAAVLTGAGHQRRIHELAGDESFTMAQLAAEVARRSGKPVAYRDLSPGDHLAALVAAGLPAPVAEMLVDADQAIRRGELDDPSRDLRRLIGRPTTPLAAAVAAAVG
jgi:NAD(P)H dehydrogenase (quinone)